MSWTERVFEASDYEAARALWAASEGVGHGPGDSEEGVHRFLRRNPGLSFVAVRDGAVVGAVLGGRDGREAAGRPLRALDGARARVAPGRASRPPGA